MGNNKKCYELTEEELRLLQKGGDIDPWGQWGPYVSEREWGTVREDYSNNGDAWSHFTHDMAHYRAYRWGEDGIAGICDRYQVLSLTHAFWNGKDPILKERLYGLSAHEGNHGEDVKECYYYLDSVPSYAYMRYLYKYPCEQFPYQILKDENAKRSATDSEYEIMDTGVFDNNRYFDVFIEYAKEEKNDICIKLSIYNRSDSTELIHVLPQLSFRNLWSWDPNITYPQPHLKVGSCSGSAQCIEIDDSNAPSPSKLHCDYHLGKYYLYADKRAELVFTNNETNRAILYGEDEGAYTKDAFHRYIINGEGSAINPDKQGTKAGVYFGSIDIPSKGVEVFYLRLSKDKIENPLQDIETMITRRKKEADFYYESKVHKSGISDEEKMIQRQALSGLLWSKQMYIYDVNQWLTGDDHKNPCKRDYERNMHWKHVISKRLLVMPDKWEYPWFAAWDLSFHCISLALVDMDAAKEQLALLLLDQFQHPNGQVPAYEWDFSDLNPPVQAWAALYLFNMDIQKNGHRDETFLKQCFHKLLLNFAWWVNKVDTGGNNVFEGGFLGLDNITLIDRSQELPGGGVIEQSDGTGWMGLFCLNLMRIALELAKSDPVYEGMAIKFFEHFVYISNALVNTDSRDVQNWDEEDGFFYDVLNNSKDGSHMAIKLRSLVGLIPLYAVDCITSKDLERFPNFAKSFRWFLNNQTTFCEHAVTHIRNQCGEDQYVLTLMDITKIQRILARVWDPSEFRSDHGLRSLSKVYEQSPYMLLDNHIQYEPGESCAQLMGGNSNWRGPIWFPTTFLFIESLKKLDQYMGDQLIVDGKKPLDMARYFAHAMIDLFKKDQQTGSRPIYGDNHRYQKDPHFNDYLLFYEYFHGDTGQGLGASHQTGWTALVANLIDEWGLKDS